MSNENSENVENVKWEVIFTNLDLGNWIIEEKDLSEVGFEPTPTIVDQNAQLCFRASISLESGALDRSAILTCLTGDFLNSDY